MGGLSWSPIRHAVDSSVGLMCPKKAKEGVDYSDVALSTFGKATYVRVLVRLAEGHKGPRTQ
jgi:hypothetical protein